MRYIKMVGLLAVVVGGSLAALSAAASASTLTSPSNTTYTSSVQLTSTDWELHGPFTTIDCTHSVIQFKIQQHGSQKNAGGEVTEWYFAGCSDPVQVGVEGSIEITSGNSVRSTGATIEADTSVGSCDWTTNITKIGNLTEGSSASVDIDSAAIPRTSGSFFCGSSGEMTGSYDVVTPEQGLWVD